MNPNAIVYTSNTGYKWDMGWMHDTLKYMKAHPYDRGAMSGCITFSIYYAYNERYILSFSHDEVVHCKGTILNKLHGSMDDKFRQARLLYLYMLTHPGKKLNFMGNELAMLREWDENRQVDWQLTDDPTHADFLRYISELNRLYCQTPALWALDHTYDGFKWVEHISDDSRIFGYTRTDGKDTILVLLNFSDVSADLSLPQMSDLKLIFSTDAASFSDRLPPYSGMVFACTKE